MNHVSLFSGVGMIDLAAQQLGYRTIATAEIDPFCRRVLAARFPTATHFRDVKHVHASNLALRGDTGPVELVSGGFPCQDLSVAGHAKGLAGARSGLWHEFARVIEELKPARVLIENVAVLRSRGLNAILWDLNRHGYNAQWDCLPAAGVGAPHLRDRIWIWASRWGLPTPRDTPILRPLGNVAKLVVGQVKLPRAGSMDMGRVREATPRCTIREARKTAAGRKLLLVPSPTVQDASNNGAPAQFRRNALPLNAWVRAFPTPTKRDAMGGPGTSPKREGGKNLRTVAQEEFGDYKLSPLWVEWLMGLPANWTNPDVPNAKIRAHNGWRKEPLPRVGTEWPHRRQRLMALGNGAVPQVAAIPLAELTN